LDTPVPHTLELDPPVAEAVARGVVQDAIQAADALAPAPPARSTVRLERRDGYLVAQLRGEISCGAMNHLTELAEALAVAGSRNLVLDLSRLYDLDEAAIAQLGVLRRALVVDSGELWLTGLRPWVRRLFEHMCTKDAFRIRATVAEAVAELTSSVVC
jgi:anti-anti-sigma regulatory factor